MFDALTSVIEVQVEYDADIEVAVLGDLQLAMVGGGAGGNVALD
jgi:hypothetical protein